jgi:hypothetical protein
MSHWKVIYTHLAERDLLSIYEYIAFSLLEPEAARKQARRILDAVANKIAVDYDPLPVPDFPYVLDWGNVTGNLRFCDCSLLHSDPPFRGAKLPPLPTGR